MKEITKERKKKMFEYLEILRDSGITNMYGAGSYLREMFDITKKQSYEVLKEWMDNY